MRGGTVRKSVPKCRNSSRRLSAGACGDRRLAHVRKSRLKGGCKARLPAPQNWQNFGRTTLDSLPAIPKQDCFNNSSALPCKVPVAVALLTPDFQIPRGFQGRSPCLRFLEKSVESVAGVIGVARSGRALIDDVGGRRVS